jgi:hypothetical protein
MRGSVVSVDHFNEIQIQMYESEKRKLQKVGSITSLNNLAPFSLKH